VIQIGKSNEYTRIKGTQNDQENARTKLKPNTGKRGEKNEKSDKNVDRIAVKIVVDSRAYKKICCIFSPHKIS
jgi:hypothetical protein